MAHQVIVDGEEIKASYEKPYVTMGDAVLVIPGRRKRLRDVYENKRDRLARKVEKANGSTYLYRLNQTGDITHKRWQRKGYRAGALALSSPYKDSRTGFC